MLRVAPGFVVLSKPAGLACHPLRPDERGTLANALVARHPRVRPPAPRPARAAYCHRLGSRDLRRHPRGAHPEAFAALRAQFRARTVEKVYLALVRGEVAQAAAGEEVRIALSLGGRGPAPRVWRGPRDGRELPAVTTYRRLWARAGLSLLEVRIETGVRYQIRAHLAALGHPLAGDALYGGGPPPAPLAFHLLHAQKLGFDDPETSERVEVTAPLPAPAANLLRLLQLPSP